MNKGKWTTKKILENIKDNGGFDNFNHWNRQEIQEWVKAQYDCSDYVAKNTSYYLAK